MLKPQIALPFALPLLRRCNRRGLAWGLGLLLALSVMALVHTRTGPVPFTISWLQVLPSFQGGGHANVLAALWPLVANRQAIAVTLALLLSLLLALGLGVAFTRRRLQRQGPPRSFPGPAAAHPFVDPLELAGLCGVLGLVGFYHLHYDNIMLFPALLALWRATLQQPRWGTLLLTLAMALSVWTPPSLLEAVPGIASIQAAIWSVGGLWLLLRLLAHAGIGARPAAAVVGELKPAG